MERRELNYYRDIFAKFIEEVNLPRYREDANFGDEMAEWSYRFRRSDLSDYYFYKSGCCRAVFGNIDWDFVFKIAFYIDDEEVDYCANEQFLYEKALENGVNGLFAETFCIGNVGGFTVYVMEKCDCDEGEVYSLSSDAVYADWCRENQRNPNDEDAQSDFSNSGYYDDIDTLYGIIKAATKGWSKKLAEKVLDFCNSYEINDCHCANWGVASNGQLVIVDYAGYGTGARYIEKCRLGLDEMRGEEE